METEIASLETNVSVYDHELDDKRNQIFLLDQEVSKGQELMMKYIHEITQLETRKIETDERRKYAIEVGDKQAKAKELSKMLRDAKLEYEDRKKRQIELKADVEFLVQDQYEHNQKIAGYRNDASTLSSAINNLNNRIELLQHRLKRPFEGQQGVQAVLDNKNALSGIHDAIGQLFKPVDEYETAISTALAGSITHIVTTSDQDAVNAINFLKSNRSGRATFIPLTVVRARNVSIDALTVCNHSEGFQGVGSDFINNDDQYDDLRDSLLGNVLIVDTIESANALAKKLRHAYKIVTMDGDVIHRGGIMSGGKNRSNNNSMMSLNKDLKKFEEELLIKKEQLLSNENKSTALSRKISENGDKLMERRLAFAQIGPLVDVKESNYERIKNQYEELGIKEDNEPIEITDDLISKLNNTIMKRDELTSNLSLLRERRNSLNSEVKRKEASFREDRGELNQFTQKIHQLKISEAKYITRLENSLDRLASEYQMTHEYAYENIYDEANSHAREEVQTLRQEILNLGNVNLEAPQEYLDITERYEFLKKQLDDLQASRDKLLSIIEEMDQIMVVQFKEMFDKINNELNDVFSALFGGGKARLILEDEEDLLNTGIDIDVQPPGKSVQNIRLFSGGEKSLIAISVLFAILKARHVPLCIFDEVEAALDQANVERLAHYIQNFAGDTQFILITHRPGTMTQCDVLYGVTMPTKGVSNMLKVKLHEAIELKEAT